MEPDFFGIALSLKDQPPQVVASKLKQYYDEGKTIAKEETRAKLRAIRDGKEAGEGIGGVLLNNLLEKLLELV